MIHPLIAALDRRRKELRYSQSALAREIGTAQSHISEILSGGASPTLGVLDRLCGALGVQLAVLVDGEPYAAMHPATAAVASNQRRLAAALQDMAGVMTDLAKVMEAGEGQ